MKPEEIIDLLRHKASGVKISVELAAKIIAHDIVQLDDM